MSSNTNRNGIIIGAATALVIGVVTYAAPSRDSATTYVETAPSPSTTRSASDASRDIMVDAFTSISVEGALELDVRVGGEQKIALSADEDFIDRVEFYVRDGQLIIDMDGPKNRDWDDADVEVSITLPKLDGFELKGAADVEITNIDSEKFLVDLRGAGNIELSGKCGFLEVENRGVANLEAKNLKCEEADVTLKGVGNLEIYASKSVRARVKGLGSIEISGDPEERDERVDGLGSIEFR